MCKELVGSFIAFVIIVLLINMYSEPAPAPTAKLVAPTEAFTVKSATEHARGVGVGLMGLAGHASNAMRRALGRPQPFTGGSTTVGTFDDFSHQGWAAQTPSAY